MSRWHPAQTGSLRCCSKRWRVVAPAEISGSLMTMFAGAGGGGAHRSEFRTKKPRMTGLDWRTPAWAAMIDPWVRTPARLPLAGAFANVVLEVAMLLLSP